jgi:hypothetical protein
VLKRRGDLIGLGVIIQKRQADEAKGIGLAVLTARCPSPHWGEDKGLWRLPILRF